MKICCGEEGCRQIKILNLYFKNKRHFEWTKTYTKRRFDYDFSPICKICEFATKHFEEKRKNIINLDKFWNDEHCDNMFVLKFLNKR